MDKDSRLTIEYLRAQPRGGVVHWASDHVTAERPWATAWIDVRIPDGGPPDMAWVWTILSPDDPDQGEPEQLWQFPWPQDLAIHSVFDPGQGRHVDELPVPFGETPPERVIAAYQRRAHEVERAYREKGEKAAAVPAAIYADLVRDGGSAYCVRSGWSARTVAEALASWAAGHAGRADLRFEWDPDAGDSETLTIVKERAKADGPTWNLGDGLKVADGVMDDLLALDPDEAARITESLREVRSRLNGHD